MLDKSEGKENKEREEGKERKETKANGKEEKQAETTTTTTSTTNTTANINRQCDVRLLLSAADFFDVPDLVSMCSDFLQGKVTCDTAAELLILAHNCHAASLKVLACPPL